MGYIYRQRQCKLSVPLNDRTKELNSYPRFNDWLDVVNVRKEVVQVRERIAACAGRAWLVHEDASQLLAGLFFGFLKLLNTGVSRSCTAQQLCCFVWI